MPSEVMEERKERVVLFAGDRAAVHRDVRVSVRRPRGGTIGRVVMQWMELLLLSVLSTLRLPSDTLTSVILLQVHRHLVACTCNTELAAITSPRRDAYPFCDPWHIDRRFACRSNGRL